MKKTIKISLKNIICFLLAIIVIYSGGMKIWASTIDTQSITFTDASLYNALKTKLSQYIISREDSNKTLEIRKDGIPNIRELDLSNAGISNIAGLENFTALTTLQLSKNNINNISNLSSLTNMKTLNLSNNVINNIDPISSLTGITNLNVSSNKITDITGISNLSNLQTLDVSNNALSTVAAVKNLASLKNLNVSQNSSLANLSDVLVGSLTSLNISSTAITNIEGITNCSKLVELKMSNNKLTSLTPIFTTEKVEDETLAILRNLEKLDIGYTTNSGATFSNFKKITACKELYAQGLGISNVSGITDMINLEYINLDDNKINNISYFKTTTTQNGKEVIKYLTATQISMANNQIKDISVLGELTNIEYLNLSGNNIQIITPIEKFNFTKGVNLRNQTIDMPIYAKKNQENHYVILFNIMQSAKNSESIAYDSNASFTTEGVTLNTQQTYNNVPYYNVIITPEKTSKDKLSITLHGGIADGTKINFNITTSTSAVETLLFEDSNLDKAIYEYLSNKLGKNSYIARAPYIINITQSEISNVKELDISSKEIKNLKGISNFSNLENLNTSNNKISNDSEIKYLTKLKTLNCSNNELNNSYTSIEQIPTLENLDISGNNIKDLNSLSNYIDYMTKNRKTIKLSTLILANNQITDIQTLSKLTTLQNINISNNQLNDINNISTNTGITTFNMSGNNIEDISVLSKLANLKTLNISNNLIQDISPISNLALTTLDISGNRIVNIEPIKNQIGIINLYMNNNKISDVSNIEGLLLKGEFEAKQQKLIQVLDKSQTGDITVNLPPIFKAAKMQSSKVYTATNFSLENCELSSDGNSIQINTDNLGDTRIARVTIVGGNADGTTFSVADALKGTITYTPNAKTKENVTATISFNRNGATILNNNGSDKYVFEQNGEFKFIYQDEYGFDGEEIARVDWIDKEGPQVTIEYSTQNITNSDVTVTITSNEKLANQINGWNFTNEEHLIMTKTFNQNTEETLQLQDELGNISTAIVSIKNIDKVAPKISGVENNKTYENSVTPNIEDENLDTITLLKDGNEVKGYVKGQTISQKGNYKLTVTDKAGNKSSIEFIINKTIDDSIKSSKYTISENTKEIIQISPETTLTNFKGNINTEVGYKINNLSDKTIANTDIIGTGYKLITDTGKQYTLIVKGDINGDGKITLIDVSKIKKHYLGIESLKDAGLKGADVNCDGKVSLIDVSIEKKVYLGIQKI